FMRFYFVDHYQNLDFAKEITEKISGHFGDFMRDVPREAALDELTKLANAPIFEKRNGVITALNQRNGDDIERARAGLIYLASIGLNQSEKKADVFVRSLENTALFPRSSEFLKGTLSKGGLNTEAGEVNGRIQELRDLLTQMQSVDPADL